MELVQKQWLCDKYDAVTTNSVRKRIVSSFTDADSILRVVCHSGNCNGAGCTKYSEKYSLGPPSDVATYLQESGRIGRDGQQSITILYYGENDLKSDHISLDLKEYYCNSAKCQRQVFLSTFSSGTIVKPDPLHFCCGVCTNICACELCSNPMPSMDLKSFENGPDDSITLVPGYRNVQEKAHNTFVSLLRKSL